MQLIVCPQSALAEAVRLAPRAPVLSLVSPGSDTSGLGAATARLLFHDIVEPREGLTLPDKGTVQSILTFGRSAADALIIHCFAGVSRSTAAAYIIAADRGFAAENDLALALRRLSPEATPNARLIALADDILERQGRMSAAVQAIGRGQETFEGRLFVWMLG